MIIYKFIRHGLDIMANKLLFVINPTSTAKILWDFFMLFILTW